MKQRYPYQDGLFVDDQGRRWQRTNDYVEPVEVRSLLREAVHGLVEWCGVGAPPAPKPFSLENSRGTSFRRSWRGRRQLRR